MPDIPESCKTQVSRVFGGNSPTLRIIVRFCTMKEYLLRKESDYGKRTRDNAHPFSRFTPEKFTMDDSFDNPPYYVLKRRSQGSPSIMRRAYEENLYARLKRTVKSPEAMEEMRRKYDAAKEDVNVSSNERLRMLLDLSDAEDALREFERMTAAREARNKKHGMTVDSPDSPAEKEAEAFAEEHGKQSNAVSATAPQATEKAATIHASGTAVGFALDTEQEKKVGSALSESGRPLPEKKRTLFERMLGRVLKGVRIHTGETAERAADAMNAKAFTVGTDIVFGRDEYNIGTKEGDHLLAHEMAHVAQGAGSIQRAPKDKAAEMLVKADLVPTFLKLAIPVQTVIAGAMAGYVDVETMGIKHKLLYDEALAKSPNPRLYAVAFAAGSIATTGSNILELIGGISGEGLGVTLDASGVAALGGLTLNFVSATAITHGYLTTVAGIHVSLDALRHMSMMTGEQKRGNSDAPKQWRLGKFKSEEKWQNQMIKRGWTPEQIAEALNSKEFYKAENKVNPGNPATRYVHPTTGRSVVIDNVTNEILQIGGDGFEWQ